MKHSSQKSSNFPLFHFSTLLFDLPLGYESNNVFDVGDADGGYHVLQNRTK